MSSCPGLHCDGCGGKGGGALAVLVVLALIAAAVARPVHHAVDTIGHVMLEALEIAGIVLVSAAGFAVLTAATVFAVHARRRVLAARIRQPLEVVSCQVVSPADTAPAAIEAPTADQLAARDALRAEALEWAYAQIAARNERGRSA